MKLVHYDEILEAIISSTERRDGGERVAKLREEIRDFAMEGMKREMVCQILARETLTNRIRFMILYPEIILPYLIRMRRRK